MKKINRFGILAFAGLGKIAIKELGICSPENITTHQLKNYDFISFTIKDRSNIMRLKELRIAEDIFYLQPKEIVLQKKKDLINIKKFLSRNWIIDGIGIKNELFTDKKSKSIRFYSFVKQDMDRILYRNKIVDSIIISISSLFPKWKIGEPATNEFWGFYIEEKLFLGLRLSNSKMRYHGNKPPSREGSLRPTIASAMIYVCSPKNNETIVDPMCGTGTILREGYMYNNKAKYIGGDIDIKAVNISNKFVKNISNWDASNLPFEDGEIDCIVTNMPFGKKYSSIKDNLILYEKLLKHWKKKLKRNGKMLLLTADDKSIKRSLQKIKLKYSIAFKVKVLGLWAKAYFIH